MTTRGLCEGVEALRRAKLPPTRQRVTVAALVFSGPTLALTAGELQDRAVDADLYLSRDEAEAALDELRGAGVVPLLLEPEPELPVDVVQAASLLQAMGNPHRLRVLRELIRGERCAGDLSRTLGLLPSTLSQHLARLRADGLVRQRRVANRVYYSLAGKAAQSVLRSLAA
jgi:DNA-binding transcriptional ArsR family regulator